VCAYMCVCVCVRACARMHSCVCMCIYEWMDHYKLIELFPAHTEVMFLFADIHY